MTRVQCFPHGVPRATGMYGDESAGGGRTHAGSFHTAPRQAGLAGHARMQIDSHSRFIDLSHTIEERHDHLQGAAGAADLRSPVPRAIAQHLCARHRVPDRASSNGLEPGTYLDTPFHRYADGIDCSGLALESISDCRGRRSARVRHIAPWTAHSLARSEVRGRAVLVHTGWDRHWRTDQYFEGFPFLTEQAASICVMRARRSSASTRTTSTTRHWHLAPSTRRSCARDSDVEHMTNLGALPLRGFHFTAVPPKISGMGSFPVRAHARL